MIEFLVDTDWAADYLKGEESPPRIHDLVVLARRAGVSATLERDLTELSRVYVVTRGPAWTARLRWW